jgi:hypothetical protein
MGLRPTEVDEKWIQRWGRRFRLPVYELRPVREPAMGLRDLRRTMRETAHSPVSAAVTKRVGFVAKHLSFKAKSPGWRRLSSLVKQKADAVLLVV